MGEQLLFLMSNHAMLRTKSEELRSKKLDTEQVRRPRKRVYSMNEREKPINDDCWHSRNYPPTRPRKEVIDAYKQGPVWLKRKISAKYRETKLKFQSQQLK